jgi:DNA-binding NarL/FixJ family response regulator
MIRVGLADDQALVRSGFAALLDAEDDITVVGKAADGDSAVRLAAREKPDVLLMDIRMPGLDGIEATRRIAARPGLADVHVVILTTFELDEYIFDGLRAGAAGFLVKDTDAAELIRAVRVVAAGESLLSPTVTRRVIAEFATHTKTARPVRGIGDLTAREREVVTLVASGLSNEEIAQRIYVSQSTVKTHMARAMMKLSARDRAQLVVFAYEAGLARPGWALRPGDCSQNRALRPRRLLPELGVEAAGCHGRPVRHPAVCLHKLDN